MSPASRVDRPDCLGPLDRPDCLDRLDLDGVLKALTCPLNGSRDKEQHDHSDPDLRS